MDIMNVADIVSLVSSVQFAEGVWGGGLTPHCMRTTSPLELVWGVGFDPPEGFQEHLDETWGYKKIFCSLRSQIKIKVQSMAWKHVFLHLPVKCDAFLRRLAKL